MAAAAEQHPAGAIRAVRRRKAWQFAAWAGGSITAGAVAWAMIGDREGAPADFGRAVAIQFLIWGVINAIFAVMGLTGSAAQRDAAAELQERDKLIRILRFNGKLNLLWIAIGVNLLFWAAVAGLTRADAKGFATLLGHAAGVLVQGGFLMGFDRAFLRALGAENRPAATAGRD